MPAQSPHTLVVLKPAEVLRHRDQGLAVAQRLLADFAATPAKPYDQALGCVFALAALCKQFGWDPRDFHQWIAAEFPPRD